MARAAGTVHELPPGMDAFHDARRHQQSLLWALERRTLGWLARHTPSWLSPDHFTLLGLCATVLAGLCYALCRQHRAWLCGVNAALALNWLGDSLDGTLARHRHRLRPRYGFYVDHLVDALGLAFTLGGFAVSGLVHGGLAIGVLVLYLVQSINVYLATYTLGEFRLSFWKLGPTEARLLLGLGNLAMLIRPNLRVGPRVILLGDVGAVASLLALLAILAASATRNTLALYRDETPAPGPGH